MDIEGKVNSMNSFVYISNTPEEFEVFVEHEKFFWPRGLMSRTSKQSSEKIPKAKEEVGDEIIIVTGKNILGKMRNPELNDLITSDRMLTHRGRVKHIHERPLIGYRYSPRITAGNNKKSYVIPLELMERIRDKGIHRGQKISSEEMEDLNQWIEFGNLITDAINTGEIGYVPAYTVRNEFTLPSRYSGLPDSERFVVSIPEKDGTYFRIDGTFEEVSIPSDMLEGKRKNIQFINRETLSRIMSIAEERGLDSQKFVKHLRVWGETEYLEINLYDAPFLPVHMEGGLRQGDSAYLISEEDDSNKLINAIHEALDLKNISMKDSVNLKISKNQILYGPPGTGKTFSIIEKALEIVDPIKFEKLKNAKAKRHEWVKLYDEYVEEKRIRFCTFHQSFSYEDFVEGLRSDGSGNFRPQMGIFREMCMEAGANHRKRLINSGTRFYKMALGRKDIDEELAKRCLDEGIIAIGFGSEIDLSDYENENEMKAAIENELNDAKELESTFSPLKKFKFELKKGDYVIISNGIHKFRAIGRITGDYHYDDRPEMRYSHTREVEWLFNGNELPVEDILKDGIFGRKTLHSLESDRLRIDKIRELIDKNTNEDEKNYVLIMDEINRGNISKVFGELITLIEEDKRLGEQNQIVVTLPYSREAFGVPSNLYLLGTMNTADRSISLMDTALRRRFDFIELPPEEDLLPTDVEGIDVCKMLKVMNERIEYLYDRDHRIGHGFFMEKDLDINKLMDIMRNKVIPLLQEYFYEDWENIARVLGGVSGKGDRFIEKRVMNPGTLFGKNTSGRLNSVDRFMLHPSPEKGALLAIYEELS